MASGLPAVGTRHAGIPEAISHGTTGLLVEEHDSDALAAALIRLLTSAGLWEAVSAAGCEQVRERFELATQTRALSE